jgi:hypothetical protein
MGESFGSAGSSTPLVGRLIASDLPPIGAFIRMYLRMKTIPFPICVYLRPSAAKDNPHLRVSALVCG